jgi:MFS superfamily sulfate permease-like transporter
LIVFCSHGAGGLAGQYRFGARSEMSIIILGSCKLLLGILFGSSLVGLLDLFPKSILAVMLFVSAIEVTERKTKPLTDHSLF